MTGLNVLQGTRSRDQALPFKNGAFNLAAELGTSLLPVSIVIQDDAWLNGSKVTF
jgi:1-acyl-sn-glycerol-3-phosphate acyltransferase